jgi:hypothetical protein
MKKIWRSKRHIFRYLWRNGIDCHGGKSLHWVHSRCRYSYLERDRNYEDLSHFLTIIRGNFIKTYQIKNIHESNEIRELIVKTPIKEYEQHMNKFKEASPTLNWWVKGSNGKWDFLEDES